MGRYRRKRLCDMSVPLPVDEVIGPLELRYDPILLEHELACNNSSLKQEILQSVSTQRKNQHRLSSRGRPLSMSVDEIISAVVS